MYNLDDLKLIAQGGQALIYEIDDNKILRVLRSKEEGAALKAEMATMTALYEKGKTVPKIYDYIEIDGKPAIVMEHLHGLSLLELFKKQPLKLAANAVLLANLHLETAEAAEGLPLMSINDRAAYLTKKADIPEAELKAFVLALLSELPRGNSICHGDFHPGNIIINNKKYYIIDWFGATSGDIQSDIAHTYLILRNTPKMPGLSKAQITLQHWYGSLLSRKYLYACNRLHKIDWGNFSKWLIVRAAERLYYGMPQEKPALISFLRSCKKAQVTNMPVENWWKLL